MQTQEQPKRRDRYLGADGRVLVGVAAVEGKGRGRGGWHVLERGEAVEHEVALGVHSVVRHLPTRVARLFVSNRQRQTRGVRASAEGTISS
eukprot:1254142-Rhodomonas_salina.1